MFRPCFSVLFLLALLVLSLPAAAAADWVADLAADFRPAVGVVIMPAENEFLVDLDAAKGVRVGDLLAVVKPGEKIVHPVTKEILGDLAEVKGVLQVTRVKSGYSYASPVGAANEIGRGDAVRRFEKVPAVFRASGQDGREVYEQVTAALPFLDWQGYQPTAEGAQQATPLLFILRDGRLEVQGPQGTILHQYATRPVSPDTADSRASLPATTPSAVVLAAPAVASQGEASASPIIRRQTAAGGDRLQPRIYRRGGRTFGGRFRR